MTALADVQAAAAFSLFNISPVLTRKKRLSSFTTLIALCRKFDLKNSQAAADLVDVSPELIELIGFKGLSQVAGLSSRMALIW